MKKNLGKIIALSLLTASVYTIGGASNVFAKDVYFFGEKNDPSNLVIYDGNAIDNTIVGKLDGSRYNVYVDKDHDNYDKYDVKLNCTYANDKDKDAIIYKAMTFKDGNKIYEFTNVNIGLQGKAYYYTGGLMLHFGEGDPEVNNVIVNIDNYHQENNFETRDVIHPETEKRLRNTFASVGVGGENNVVNITKSFYLKSYVEDTKTDKSQGVAHNGVYASGGGTINIDAVQDKGIYIDVNSKNLNKIYDGDNYGESVVKNDAVSGKNGGTVNVNNNGTAGQVEIYGNLDAKKGNVNVSLLNDKSLWHGSQANYVATSEEGTLNVILANGAQWVPDGYQKNDLKGNVDAIGVERITQLTLKNGGIVNLHGYNKYIDPSKKTPVNELHIDKLTTKGGIFRMDINAPAETYKGRNGSDFVFVEKGSGDAYVQPVLENKNDLSKITYDNPVWFADADKDVTFNPYLVEEKIEDGFLYDYKPEVDKNVVSTDTSQHGNNWYLVGVTTQNTPTTDTVIGAAAVDYATATARLEIDSLNKRLGELRDYDTAEKDAWVRFKAGEMEGDGSSYFNNKYRFYQIGYDAKENTNEEKDGRWHKGFAIHYTEGESSYLHGNGENTSRGASLYAGWEGNKGHYADYVLKYSHLHNDFTSHALDGTADGSFSNYALSASVEYGRKNLMKHDWIFEPQTQLVYTYLSDADYSTSNRIQVSQDSVNSLIGRVGFRLGREYDQEAPERRSKWYVKADILHEFCGDRDISLLSADGSQTLHESVSGHDTWFVWGLGGDIALDKNSYFYCDLERSFAGDIDEKWQANVGLRWEW